MALIQNSKKRRKNGEYSRLFGNKELGMLLSQVRATSIRAGNGLENIINHHAHLMMEEELEDFTKGTLKTNEKSKFIITKKLIKKLTKFINCKKEPDYCVLVLLENKAFIIELKDGDTFDTKKVAGEIESLNEFANKFKLKLEYQVFSKFCSFNLNDKKKIIHGLKGKISEEMAMTGSEFCELLEIDYPNIIEQRKQEAHPNLDYFLNKLAKIPEVKNILCKII